MNRAQETNMIGKKLAALLTAAVLVVGVAACDDNAQDHEAEAIEEMQEGDVENAAESMEDAQEDLEQGDTTELLN
jgi:cellobiose-specific phosphotransferase system component IIA